MVTLFALVAGFALVEWAGWDRATGPEPGEGEGREVSGTPAIDAEAIDREMRLARLDLDGHRPELAAARLRELLERLGAGDRSPEVRMLLDRAETFALPFVRFREIVTERASAGTPLTVTWEGSASELSGWTESGLVFHSPGGASPADDRAVRWGEVSGRAMLGLLLAAQVERTCPLETAAFALASGEVDPGKEILALYLRENPGRGAEVNELYERFASRAPPPGGWVLVGDRLGSGEELAAREAERARESAEALEKERRDLEALRAALAAKDVMAAAREAARQELDARLAGVGAYLLTQDYNRAILALERHMALLEVLRLDDLAARVRDALFEARGEAALFDRLLSAVNDGRLVRRPVWRTASGSFEVELSGATREGVLAAFPEGEVRIEWKRIDPSGYHEFCSALALTVGERYFLGGYCLDRGLEGLARREWVQVLRSGPTELRERVNRRLARHLGIDLPLGGFVVHESRIVTFEEKAHLDKGLVFFKGEWVTPAERDRTRAGLVQYRGRWMGKRERDALAALEAQESYRAREEGFAKERGRWVYRFQKEIGGELYLSVHGRFHEAREARELRSQWENAWKLRTEHYDLVTNCSEKFATEWADFMEEAWKAYASYFDVEAKRRFELYAFRTFEDYRKYCMETGNEAQLQAAGFADSAQRRGVGWSASAQDKILLETMIHEAAHLYHFDVLGSLDLPSWYYEGTAELFQGFRWDRAKGVLELDYLPASNLAHLKSRIFAGSPVQIEDLIRGDAHQAIAQGPSTAMDFYAGSWGLMYFLEHVEEPRIRPLAAELLRKLQSGGFPGARGGTAGRDPITKTFGPDLKGFQEMWEAFLKGLG
ncbi:MAG: hypothetical protein HY720_22915 [Planctomycetes bacterium]|nr:hypothetical protein [Planctomycetota bacterium]